MGWARQDEGIGGILAESMATPVPPPVAPRLPAFASLRRLALAAALVGAGLQACASDPEPLRSPTTDKIYDDADDPGIGGGRDEGPSDGGERDGALFRNDAADGAGD